MPATKVPTNEQVLEALDGVDDPELHRSIVELDMVSNIRISPRGVVEVEVALTIEGSDALGVTNRGVAAGDRSGRRQNGPC